MATVTCDCDLSSIGPPIALVNIQAGETQICNFLNIKEEPEPQTCIECVTTFLTEEELAEFVAIPDLIPQNIEELCEAIETEVDEGNVDVLDTFAILLLDPNLDGDMSDQIADETTIAQLIDCLERVLGLQTEAEPIEP